MKTVIKKTRRYVCMEIFRNFMTGLDILMYSSLIWLLYSLAVIKTIHGLEMTGLLWWRQFDGLSISHAPPSVPWALTQRAQERKIRVSVQTEMARRCVLGCGSPETLFPIPKVPWLRSRWLGFLHFEEGGISERSRLCSRHFTRECFKNWTQHEMGFVKYLSLTETAVPSVHTVGPSQRLKVSVTTAAKPQTLNTIKGRQQRFVS